MKKENENNMKVPGHYWSALKNENHNGTLPEVESWLYKADIQLKNHKTERKLRSMKTYFFTHKLKFLYTFIILALLIGACSMPVTQHETLGTILTWVVDKNNTSAQDEINKLSFIKNGNLSKSENDNNGQKSTVYTLVMPNATEKDAKDYAKQIESIPGVLTMTLLPVGQDVKRPLYSAALNSIFKIDIDATNMTDKEVEEQLTKQMREAGMEPTTVFISKDANGHRMIRMNMDDQKEPQSFEMNIKDGNDHEVFKTMTKHDDGEFKGLTDKQIRDKVRQDTGNPNLKDSEIQITREGENVKVKLEVEHIDGNMLKRNEK